MGPPSYHKQQKTLLHCQHQFSRSSCVFFVCKSVATLQMFLYIMHWTWIKYELKDLGTGLLFVGSDSLSLSHNALDANYSLKGQWHPVLQHGGFFPVLLLLSSPRRPTCICSAFSTVVLLSKSSPSFITLAFRTFSSSHCCRCPCNTCMISSSFSSNEMGRDRDGWSHGMGVPTTPTLSLPLSSCRSVGAVWPARLPPSPLFRPRARPLLLPGPLS